MATKGKHMAKNNPKVTNYNAGPIGVIIVTGALLLTVLIAKVTGRTNDTIEMPKNNNLPIGTLDNNAATMEMILQHVKSQYRTIDSYGYLIIFKDNLLVYLLKNKALRYKH